MDERRCLMASSARRPMVGEQQQPPELSLNCPRCDSSNTKFCYYNNYSLSQPRHFCKACKRYWTRGGTIRNVPVGGGSRKNKRVKRSHTASVTTTVAATDHLPSTHHSSHIVKPIFTEMNTVPTYYPRLSSNTLQDQLGLGYSSGQLLSGHRGHSLHDMASSGDVLPSDYSSNWIPCITSTEMITGSSTTTATCTTVPSINSLLASTIQHKTFSNSGDLQLKDHSSKAVEDCKAFSPLNILQDPRNGSDLLAMKEAVKVQNNYMNNNIPGGGGWNFGYQNHHYPSEQVGLSSSDPSTNYYCNMSNVIGNNLYDPANTESSVPSLVKLSSIFANQSQDHLR